MTLPNLREQERQSVIDLPDARKGESAGDFLFWFTSGRGPILPAWASRERERVLRLWSRNEYNWLGQAAFAGLTKKWSATPWEIKGKRRVSYFQEVLRQAHFGAGWDQFLQRVGFDFLRQDGGAYIEIIAPGSALRAPTGSATGLAHLDSLRCWPTGDPEFPVIYYSRKGTKHLLHHTRVMQIVDNPDGDESNPGYGLCALSRAISIVVQQQYMMRFVQAKLDDKPQPGYMIASNIEQGARNAAFVQYQMEQTNDEKPAWGNTMWLYSIDPSAPAKLEPVTFSQAPDAWSFKEYTELHVNAWAAALGVDVQELWQLTGGNLGSGQQSQILHAKSQGRTFGAFLIRMERLINDALPESLEFEFKDHDPYEAQERAQTASVWAGFVTAAGDAMSAEEKRQLLANQVEAFKDAVTDENGEIRRLDDADVEPETTADDGTDNVPETSPDGAETQDSEKALPDTRAAFESAFSDLVAAARAKDIDRRRFGIIARDLVRKHGLDAYRDGLKEGGVLDDALSDDDQARYLALLAAQSRYVTAFGDTLYRDGMSDGQAEVKPDLWYNKSISPFHQAGVLSADRNGMYRWELGRTEQHCPTCQLMNGQIHRYKTYMTKGITPRSSQLACKGYLCDCQLRRVSGRAVGRFPTAGA